MSDNIAELDNHEATSIFPSFSSNVAWELGSLIRQEASSKPQSIVISITDAKGLIYFQATSKPGINMDNQHWVERKRRTVIDFECATLYMGAKLRKEGKTLEEAFFKSQNEYCTHGGGFPIRVQGVEGIVGVIVVSGLAQVDDHQIIVDCIAKYLRGNK